MTPLETSRTTKMVPVNRRNGDEIALVRLMGGESRKSNPRITSVCLEGEDRRRMEIKIK